MKNLEKEIERAVRKRDLNKIEEIRKISLSIQNPIIYYISCYEMGLKGENIEDPLLYEIGLLENKKFYEGTPEKKEKTQKERKKYINFYNEVKKRKINFVDLDAEIQTKKELLEKYFPGRFGKNGVQDLSKRNYTDKKIGEIFKKLFYYSEKFIL